MLTRVLEFAAIEKFQQAFLRTLHGVYISQAHMDHVKFRTGIVAANQALSLIDPRARSSMSDMGIYRQSRT
jgi:hypothetical protein